MPLSSKQACAGYYIYLFIFNSHPDTFEKIEAILEGLELSEVSLLACFSIIVKYFSELIFSDNF